MFLTTVNQILILFGYMAIGFVLKRCSLTPDNTHTVIARLLNLVLMPATIINTFMDKCTIENLKAKWTLIVYSSIILAVCIVVGILLGRLFSKDSYTERIYRYSLTVGNFAFIGIAFIEGLLPDLLFDYLLFILPMNLYTFSLGVAWLIPNDKGTKITIKNFLNPICISLIIGAILGLTNTMSFLPKSLTFLPSIIQGTAKTMAPMAMILTGFVIGSYPILSQLKNPKVYTLVILRIAVIPLIIVIVLRAVNTPQDIINVALCANAMPSGLNTVVIPASYGKDAKLGGSMALGSQLMCIVTIPILFSMFLG